MRFLCFILAVLLAFPGQSLAIGLIRDAEIEKTLGDYSAPIFRAAGIDPASTRIYIVNDNGINAFTAGGLNVFVNTGLILRTDNSNMVIGVLAHEIGHIAGGHIVKRAGEAENLSVQSVLTAVLGAAVSVAGLPNAGIAVLGAGSQITQRNYMRFSREQEVMADASAVKFLHATNQSTNGMLKMFEILRRDQTLSYGAVDQYSISHPLSQERIAHIRSESMDENIPDTDRFAEQHQRMVAKLYGFLEKPENTFLQYSDDSIPAIYARSIAYFRQSNFDKSFAEIDKLLAREPNDPFFNELKGQFLSESGKPKEALPYYRKADQLYPQSALIKTELGKILLSESNNDEAIKQLTQSTELDKTSSETWRLLATAYGQKNEPMSNLALAEEANLKGKNDEARNFARLAKSKLPKNSPAWIRANDILSDIKLNKKKDKKEDS